MSNDRRQIGTIKQNLASKLNDELLEIVNTPIPDQWSDEAIIAAQELLDDRQSGKAHEPVIAVAVDTDTHPLIRWLQESLRLILIIIGAIIGGAFVFALATGITADGTLRFGALLIGIIVGALCGGLLDTLIWKIFK